MNIARPSSPSSSSTPSLRGSSPFSPLSSPCMPATPSSASSPVAINDASPEVNGMDLSIFAQGPYFSGYEDNAEMDQHFRGIDPPCYNPTKPCNCVLDASNYQTMLELSLRLRKAARILGHHPLHQAGGYCHINQSLMELDTLTAYVLHLPILNFKLARFTRLFTRNTLLSVDLLHHTAPSYNHTPAQLPQSLPTPHPFPHSTSRLDPWSFGTTTNATNDSLMSWRPRVV